MAKTGYKAVTGADVALVAATAKTILGVKAGAAFAVDLIQFGIGFDGVAAGNEPVLVELVYSTWATNAPGTASTSVTPVQEYGRVIAHGVTAAKAWTTEPTVLTVLDEFLVHPQSGWREFQPFGQGWDCAPSEGLALRCTAPNAVNCRASIRWERC